MRTNGEVFDRERCEELLKWHRKHLGLYARVATKHRVTAGYVSLIASGRRRSESIEATLLKELEKIVNGKR